MLQSVATQNCSKQHRWGICALMPSHLRTARFLEGNRVTAERRWAGRWPRGDASDEFVSRVQEAEEASQKEIVPPTQLLTD
jgi:hypothetical protein